MTRRKSKQEIIELLEKYNLIWLENEYKNNSTPIVCRDIESYNVLVTINNLIQNKRPSPFIKSNPYTIENIKLFLNRNNPNIILLSTEYIDSGSKLHCKCKIDDTEWFPTWDNLLQGKGCPKCSYQQRGDLYRLSIEDIKEKLKLINSNIEIISNEYDTAYTVLRLKCLLDGYEWNANWNRISQGFGCPRCSYDKMQGHYCKTLAERNKEDWLNINAIVYVIKCYNNTENFYKIGITKRNVKERFSSQKEMPYDFETLFEINTNLYEATYIEYELHKNHIKFLYEPLIFFEGHTECFSKINENRILHTKNSVENYKPDINYKTNCHIDIDNIVEDIRWLQKEQLMFLLVKLNCHKLSAQDLGLLEEYIISGYKLEDWITDLKGKLDVVSKKDEERKLKIMENKLDKMLSDDKKIELELEDIANLLKE